MTTLGSSKTHPESAAASASASGTLARARENVCVGILQDRDTTCTESRWGGALRGFGTLQQRGGSCFGRLVLNSPTSSGMMTAEKLTAYHSEAEALKDKDRLPRDQSFVTLYINMYNHHVSVTYGLL